MEKQMQLFISKEFGALEILMVEDKPYFPATECAKLLGYVKPENAISRHCHGSLKRGVIDRLGREQEKNFIPEGDLYRLIIRSKLPAAVRFEKWVFDEILPTIRQHGAYINDAILLKMLEDSDFGRSLLSDLKTEKERNTALQDILIDYTPKVRYCETILQSKNAIPISLIAKDYGMSARTFNLLLHGLGIQFKINGTWVLYQKYANMGYTQSLTYLIKKGKSVIQTYWTQKGRLFLYEILSCYGILPLLERD